MESVDSMGRRRESAVNLGGAEFPQGGFTPPEDVQCKGVPMESVDSMGMVGVR